MSFALVTPNERADSVLAHQFWLQALDRELELDTDSASHLYERAIAADPSFFPAHFALIESHRYGERRGDIPIRTRYAALATRNPDATMRCLAIAARAPTGYPAAVVPALQALESAGDRSPCSALYLTTFSGDVVPMRLWTGRILESSERATRLLPQLVDGWLRRATTLVVLGRASEAVRVCQEGLRHMPDAASRVRIELAIISALRAAGDSTLATTHLRVLTAAVERDGRPLLRFLVTAGAPTSSAFARVNNAAPVERPVTATEERLRDRVRIASASRSRFTEWSARRSLGAFLMDAGKPLEAVRELNRAIRIADSLNAPLMRLEAYRFRGRAFAKLGDWSGAERDLTRAIAAGHESGDAYFLAEAYHNLAHVYEGSNRLVDASRAVDRFIALTKPLEYAQPRMMSLHDAGMIRWKAGWPAASNAAFSDMVHVVDAQERNYYWAGQYFERIGDYDRARQYYRRGMERDRDERSLNLGGLSRVYRALGEADSAETAARLHDEAMTNERDVPLLPTLLAERGRRDEAETIARSWAQQRSGDGNLHAQSVASNALADMLLSWGNAPGARTAAMEGEARATRLNLTEEVIHARRALGMAQMKLGDVGDGLASLTSASAMARAHPTLENTVLTEAALGQAFAATNRFSEALDAFDRSARAVESATSQLDRDLDRVRFRERQLAPFDGALRVLAGRPQTTASLDALLQWSKRRKAAALTLATGVHQDQAHVAAHRILSLTELQHMLPVGSAIIDFTFPDSTLCALVITHTMARLVSMPVREDSMRALVVRLTGPFGRVYGSRIDLARAPFDVKAARALGSALLAPLEPLLRETTRLLVVPDGPLSALPFDALVLAGARDDRYAMDRFEITLTPTLEWRAATPVVENRAPLRVLAVMRDAPGVEREADAIRHAWPEGQVTMLRDADASESAVNAMANAFDVLHFASHATADDRDPLASHLRLAADSVNDGFLHLSEIAAHRRTARLVVLSACETLNGPLYDGEGLMGLARAFLMSGAREVVATAWPNGASSADLMGVFHRRLAAGASVASALRDAKMTLRLQSATAHPFYWSGFVNVTAAPNEWMASVLPVHQPTSQPARQETRHQ